MNIKYAINDAYQKLKKYNIKTAFLDSEILMMEAIKKDRKYINIYPDKKIEFKDFQYFQKLIYKRSKGMPVAYLTGKKDFWKNQFIVSTDTLIPRPDTELIIEHVLKFCKNKSKFNVLDIGVGSGCILLSILSEKKDFYGTGIDISKKCLEVSKINAIQLNLDLRAKFFRTDIDNFNLGKYDLVVSNPPYIKKLDLKYLDKGITNFEPLLALDGGLEGLSAMKKVINKTSELIKKNGKFFLEIAFDQKDKIKIMLKDKGFYVNKVIKDYAKNDRCIICTKL